MPITSALNSNLLYTDLDQLINTITDIEVTNAGVASEFSITSDAAHNILPGDRVTVFNINSSQAVGSATLSGTFDVVNVQGPEGYENELTLAASANGTLAFASVINESATATAGFLAETAEDRVAVATLEFAAGQLILDTTQQITDLNISAGDFVRVSPAGLTTAANAGVYKVDSVASSTITLDTTPTTAETNHGVNSDIDTAETSSSVNYIWKVNYFPNSTGDNFVDDTHFQSTNGKAVFFSESISISATDKKFIFVSTPGNRENDVTNTVNDGKLRLSGSGVQGQALYSFFKFAWKVVPRLPQFDFPMLSITNEQFEFRNGWYIDNSPIIQKLQIGEIDNQLSFSTNSTTETISLTDDTTGDLRQISSDTGEDIKFSTKLFTGGSFPNDTTFTAADNGSEKSSITVDEDITVDVTDTGVLTADFTAYSTSLIRTAGFAYSDVNNFYTKALYSGVITLGSFVDPEFDSLYYVQNSSTTAFTKDISYTGPANEPIAIFKQADASAPTSSPQTDIGFRSSGITPTGTVTTVAGSNGTGTITTDQANELDNVVAGDIIRLSGRTGAGAADNRIYTVITVDAGTDTLTVQEEITTGSAEGSIEILDSISAVTTDLSIFKTNEAITISNSTNNNTGSDITASEIRITSMEFAGSGNTTALGSAPAATRISFEPGTLANNQDGDPARIVSDVRSFFKIFVRERGKTYAESSASDIGVSQTTYIVYRFPVTNASDINILSTADTQIDSNDAVPADQTLNGTDFGKIQVYYLRNPQTGIDNLNIRGTYTTGTYAAGDVVQADNGRWYYCHQPESAGVQSTIALENSANPTTSFKSSTIDITAPSTIVAVGKDWSADGYAVGDIISITGSAASNDGNNYKIASISPANTITLVANSTDPNFDDLVADEGTGNNNIDVFTASAWKNWSAVKLTGVDGPADISSGAAVFPDKGGYQASDAGLQGGERELQGVYYAFDTIIDANDVILTASGDTPYVDNGNEASVPTSTTGIYEFCQWGLRQTGAINESTLSQPQYQRNGRISDLLVDFVGPTLTTRQGVFIDDIRVADQNAVVFTDYAGSVGIDYPTVVAVTIGFNSNLSDDTDAVFYLYYKTLTAGAGEPAGSYDFGQINAKQVYRSDGILVGADVNNKINGASSYTFQYAYSEDTADPLGTGNGTRTTPPVSPTDVVAVAIGLGTGVYVVDDTQSISENGASISLVAPLERNYINP